MSAPPWIEWLPEGGLLFFVVLFVSMLAWVAVTWGRASWTTNAHIPLDDGTTNQNSRSEVTHG